MKITVNGAATDVRGGSLAEVLDELGFGEAKVATAVNEDFVPSAIRATTAISQGDRVEIVAPKQGG